MLWRSRTCGCSTTKSATGSTNWASSAPTRWCVSNNCCARCPRRPCRPCGAFTAWRAKPDAGRTRPARRSVDRLADRPQDVGRLGGDALAGQFPRDHAPHQLVELLHVVEGDVRLGVGVADAGVVGEEQELGPG